jgi:hypothetical protein
MSIITSLKRIPLQDGYVIPWTPFIPNQIADVEWDKEIINDGYEGKLSYSLNEFGFRSPTVNKDKNLILFNGCSLTFGSGLALENTWSYLIASNLKKELEYMNIGLSATGPDIQILNLHWAIDNFKIDKIFWFMSDPYRQVIHYNYGHYNFYLPNNNVQLFNNKKINEDFVNLSIHLEKNNYIKLYWQLYGLFSKISDKKIESYITCWIEDFDNIIMPLKNKFNIKNLPKFNNIDIARDNLHPGNKSNLKFSEEILRNL